EDDAGVEPDRRRGEERDVPRRERAFVGGGIPVGPRGDAGLARSGTADDDEPGPREEGPHPSERLPDALGARDRRVCARERSDDHWDIEREMHLLARLFACPPKATVPDRGWDRSKAAGRDPVLPREDLGELRRIVDEMLGLVERPALQAT